MLAGSPTGEASARGDSGGAGVPNSTSAVGGTSTSGVSGLSHSPCPRPLGRKTTSPACTWIGGASGGRTQHDPCRTTWKPALLDGRNRKPHGAAARVREAWGRPSRMTAIASLSTSTP
ncbi:hypothetical protein BJF90_10090 [Pseudonocardia sp. CNS-004]|nr:hypothetical protein BJF90_10090 [Pseudonocardia sp. CNS-004]